MVLEVPESTTVLVKEVKVPRLVQLPAMLSVKAPALNVEPLFMVKSPFTVVAAASVFALLVQLVNTRLP